MEKLSLPVWGEKVVVRTGIRLKILREGEEKTTDTVALLNAGFESEEPEVIIPEKLAVKLGLWPQLPDGTEIEAYEVAGGGKVRTYRVSDCLETRVITEETTSSPVKGTAVIMEGEREVVLSDKAISAHQMILEDTGEGSWRFRGESELRESENPEFW